MGCQSLHVLRRQAVLELKAQAERQSPATRCPTHSQKSRMSGERHLTSPLTQHEKTAPVTSLVWIFPEPVPTTPLKNKECFGRHPATDQRSLRIGGRQRALARV